MWKQPFVQYIINTIEYQIFEIHLIIGLVRQCAKTRVVFWCRYMGKWTINQLIRSFVHSFIHPFTYVASVCIS